MSAATLFLLLLGFFAPHIAGALTYVALIPQAVDRSARYRTVLLACSILLSSVSWLVLSAVWADVAGPEVEVVLMMVAAVSPVAVLIAYRPPRALQRRLGVRGLLATLDVMDQ